MSSGNRFDESIKQSESTALDTGISNIGGSGSFDSFSQGSGADYVSPYSGKNSVDIGLGATANVNLLATDHGALGMSFGLAKDFLTVQSELVNKLVDNTDKQQEFLNGVVAEVKPSAPQERQQMQETNTKQLLFLGLLFFGGVVLVIKA